MYTGQRDMTKREKRLARMRNSPVGIDPHLLGATLQSYGFTWSPAKGGHRKYEHPLVTYKLIIDPARRVLPVYVKQAIAAIDAVIAAEDKKGKGE
jgi:hypothetical protein